MGMDPSGAAERLFQDHDERRRRLEERQRMHDESVRASLAVERNKARPTRSRSLSLPPSYGSAAEAGSRLFLDAERRERDRQQARDARDLEEQERWTPRWERSGPATTRRHLNLFEEAKARQERHDSRKVAHEEGEKNMIAMKAVKHEGPVNEEHLHNLHAIHAERQRKIAIALAEKQMQFAEEMNAFRSMIPDTNERRKSITEAERSGLPKHVRPSICDDPRSPRSVKS